MIGGIVLAWMRRHPIAEPVIDQPLDRTDEDLDDLSTVPDVGTEHSGDGEVAPSDPDDTP